jgi:hypothetical protein
MPTQDVLISRGVGVTLARRAGSIRRGPLIAASVACVAMVAGLVVVARSGKPAAAPTAKPTTPDLSTVPNLSSSVSQGPQGASLAQGERFFLQLADRQDPTRIAGDVTAERSVPKGERRYELTQPRAWFFLQDGRSVHVEAASGLLTVARQTAGGVGGGLESGSLVGDVVVRLFAARVDKSRPEPGVTPTVAVLRTSRLSIDWVLGQFDAPEDFDLAWETITYSGRGVLAQFDPQTRVLDSLAVATTREIVIDDRRRATKSAAVANASGNSGVLSTAPTGGDQVVTPGTEGSVTQNGTDEDDTVARIESFYTLQSPGRVRIARDQATLDAPSLRGGMRLINGELPEPVAGATPKRDDSSRGTGSPESSAVAESPMQTPPQSVPSVGVSGPQTAEPAAPSATRIWLAGPLEVRRAFDGVAPPELARDDWWARLGEKTASEAVVAQDASRGLELRAGMATVMGTRGLMTLEASVEQPVMLASVASGVLTGERVEADRTNQTVRVIGAGTLVGAAPAIEPGKANQASAGPARALTPPSIRWNESAAFAFVKGTRDFERMEQARFVGEIESASDGSVVTGGQMVVDFAAPMADQAANLLVPSRARVLGQATVADASGNRATGDVLAVEFASDGSTQARPAKFEMMGRASAEFDGQTLAANSVEGTFANVGPKPAEGTTPKSANPSTAVELASLMARGDAGTPAVFTGKDGVLARAITIEASPLDRTAILRGGLGVPARVVRTTAAADGGASSELIGLGATIALDEGKRTIVMDEGGEVSYVERIGDAEVRALSAMSRGTISFGEGLGVATMRNGVVALFQERLEKGSRRANLAAEDLTVRFERVERVAKDTPTVQAQSSTPTPAPSLAVTSLEATSAGGGSPVRAKIQEFAAGSEIPSLTYHLEAPRLSSTTANGEFEATGKGRLLATRAGEASVTSSGDPFGASGAGDTLVSWQESMRYVQSEQRAIARGLVRLANRETAKAQPSLLECETLTIDLMPAGGNTDTRQTEAPPAGMQSGSSTLRQALAEGGVWGSVQSREFTAARAIFDAAASKIDAFGDASSTVTVAATADQAPVTASRIRIDTKNGRIEVIDPGTVQTSPQGPRGATPQPMTPPAPANPGPPRTPGPR